MARYIDADALIEEWKDIKGYEGLYQVSNMGRIKSLLKNIDLKPWKHKKGYLVVTLTKDKTHKHFYIHRIVAETFLENINSKNEVNHIDGNKKNNNVCNLQWCDDFENRNHAYINGLRKGASIIEVEMCDANGLSIKKYPSITEASRETGIKSGNISKCINGYKKTAGGYVWRKVGE